MKKRAAALLLLVLGSASGCWLDDPWPTGTQISIRSGAAPGPTLESARGRLT